MFSLVVAFIVLLTTFIVCRFRHQFRTVKVQKLPTGPSGWPLLGNLPNMIKDPHLKLSQWATKFGNLYMIYLGRSPALVINDSKTLKELFSQAEATGKFKSETLLTISQGPYGMLNSEGSTWTELRNFCIKALVQFNFGNGSLLEPLILEEAQQVCDWIKAELAKSSENGVIFNDVLKHASNNALWTIISGERIALDDDKVVGFLDRFLETLQYTMKTGLGFIPWMRYIAPELSGYNSFNKVSKEIHRFIRDRFEEHKQNLVEGSSRDVFDVYLEKMSSTADPSSSFYGEVGMLNSVSSMVELFTGSGETTSATLNWLLFYLCWNPEDQKRLTNEIDDVIGDERDPSILDKLRMPFTEAVIYETFRYSALLPMGVMHQLTDNLLFHQYDLPKGLILIPNVYHCHHSLDPEIFRPNRFLDNPTLKQLIVNFQPGKRVCPGEPFVKDVMFLFVTKLFQNWEVAPNPTISKEKYFEPDVGLLLSPKRLGVMVKKRLHYL